MAKSQFVIFLYPRVPVANATFPSSFAIHLSPRFDHPLTTRTQPFLKNGRGEPFCSRRIRCCFPLKYANPYSTADTAVMSTLPDKYWSSDDKGIVPKGRR